MIIIRKRAYARAGLIGNPSDGYNGKTISISVRNFWAEVVLYEWDTVDIVLAEDDRARFSSIGDLARDVKLHGYYGGIRLIKATIKRFVEYCDRQGLTLHDRNFSVRYATNIPRQVGLAGSSAIIVATLRCLMEFYNVEIPLEVQPSFVLSIEREELGIAAGLQDRVIQVYEGLVYMDFDRSARARRCRASNAITTNRSIRPCCRRFIWPITTRSASRPKCFTTIFERGSIGVKKKSLTPCSTLRRWPPRRARLCSIDNADRLSQLMDENFNTRRSIYNLSPWQIQMVETARGCGASAKFAGSGGAIIGTYRDEAMFEQLCQAFSASTVRVIKPQVLPDEG